jgi:hypothetical protein
MAAHSGPNIAKNNIAFSIDFSSKKSYESGSSITDTVGSKTGTITGSTIDRSAGLQANGTGDGITMSSSTSLSGSTGFCISFIVRVPSSQEETWWNFLFKDDNANANYEIGIYGQNSTTFSFKDNDVSKSMSTTLSADTWRYIVAGQDASGVGYMYRDGIQVSTLSGYNSSASLNFTKICNSYSGNELKGDLLHFTAYNRMLSADEVKQNYNALRGRFPI